MVAPLLASWLLAEAVQLAGWAHAVISGSGEKYYDLLGAVTYWIVGLHAYLLRAPKEGVSARTTINTVLLLLWSARLGTFLFLRIREAGEDKRFRELKKNPITFLGPWIIQGVWVWCTAACVLVLIESNDHKTSKIGFLDIVGWLIWAVGFGLEVTADLQKRAFSQRHKGEKNHKWIQEGVWQYARHPNYAGEMTLWVGVFFASASQLKGSELLLGLLSPGFVTLLLTSISGVPLLTKSARKKWGDQAEWHAYMRTTNKFIPLPVLAAADQQQRAQVTSKDEKAAAVCKQKKEEKEAKRKIKGEDSDSDKKK